MGPLDRLKGRIVGLDTSPFIFYIERAPAYLPLVRPLFEGVRDGEFDAVTSMVSLVELLIVPLRQGHRDLAARYRELLLRSRHLRTLAVDDTLAERAADLRARYGIGVPDALQIAAAIHAHAAAFLTNDDQLKRVREIEVLVLHEHLP